MQKDKEKTAPGGAGAVRRKLRKNTGDGILNYAEIFGDEIHDANKMLYYQTEYEAKKRTEHRIKKLELSVSFLIGLLLGHLLVEIFAPLIVGK